MNPGKKVQTLIKRKPQLVAGVYDGLSAHLAKKAGFEILYLSGGGLSVGYLGKPDIGLLTMDDVVESAGRIVRAVGMPLLVDADTGFGGPSRVKKTVRRLESAGAAGIQIEDQTFPKRCGHLEGKSLVSAAAMAAKIRAAKSARRNPHFQIIARTDARGVMGLRDALRRAHLYKEAGADLIFPEALQTRGEFKQFGEKKSLGPLLANMTEFGRSPAFSVDELSRLGFRVVLFPMTAFRAAAKSMGEALKELHRKRHSRSLRSRLQTRNELYKLIHYKRN